MNFTNATKWQAEGIFKCFFPCKSTKPADDEQAEHLAEPKRKMGTYIVPMLDEAELDELSKKFGEAIPEDEMSVRLPSGPCGRCRDRELLGSIECIIRRSPACKVIC